MRKLLILALVPLLTAGFAHAAGEVYRWKDPNGTWHYSDQPRPGAELIRGPQRSALNTTSPPPATTPAVPTDAATGAPVVSEEVAQQVRSEAAAVKSEQCKKSEAYYQQVLQARRVYKTDDKGQRVFMNDEEMDAARLQARSNRDLACAP
jgi:hypothetical protein